MNPQKAIEIINLNLKEAGTKMPPDCRNAITLGREALEDHLKARAAGWFPPGYTLPSETKD